MYIKFHTWKALVSNCVMYLTLTFTISVKLEKPGIVPFLQYAFFYVAHIYLYTYKTHI